MLKPRHKKQARPILWISIFIMIVGLGIIWSSSRTEDVDTNSSSTNQLENVQESTLSESSNTNSFGFIPDPPALNSNLSPPVVLKTTADVPQIEVDCLNEEGEWAWIEESCRPVDQATCLTNDGLWGPSGESIPEGCSLWAQDNGANCQDSIDCIGRCIVAPGDIEDQSRGDDEITNITGHCTERARVSGCLTELVAGTPAVLCE